MVRGQHMKNPLTKRLLRELKEDFGKYALIFLLLVFSIGLISGFLVADGSMIKAYNDGFEKYQIENGHFITEQKMNQAQKAKIEENGVTLYDQFYVQEKIDFGARLRIYADREQVNTVCLMEGQLPQQDNEIGIDRMFAENNGISVGDTLQAGADELAGADGNIKIRFDYKNNTQENGSITPFAAITGLMLSEDNAHNITVTNGSSRYMDGEYLVYGFALPGVTAALDLDTMELTKEEEIDLHDFMEVSFEAEDFELDFTATMVSNGLLEEKDYDKVIDKLDELTDKLEDTTDQVKDLKSKISKLKNGGEKLRSGADSLYQGLSQVNAALAQAAQADPSLAGLAASVSQLTDGSKQLADGVSTYTKGVEKACDSIDDSSSSNTDDTEKKQELQSLTEKLKSLKENDGAYNNFSGLEDGKTGSVSFIIETDEIKK